MALALLLASALALLSTAERKPMPRVGLEDSDIIRRRQEWFYEQRTYPLGFIPAGARLRALRHLEEMRKRETTESTRGGAPKESAAITNAPIPAWMPLGPQPTNSVFFAPFTSGRVTALAVDRCDSSGKTVYLGGAEGGVWKTSDAGTTWTPLTDFQPSLATGSIALDTSACTGTPAHANAIYIGTGEENFSADSYYGAGVLKSTDGGPRGLFSGRAPSQAPFFPWTRMQMVRTSGPLGWIQRTATSFSPRFGGLDHPLTRGFGAQPTEGATGSTYSP